MLCSDKVKGSIIYWFPRSFCHFTSADGRLRTAGYNNPVVIFDICRYMEYLYLDTLCFLKSYEPINLILIPPHTMGVYTKLLSWAGRHIGFMLPSFSQTNISI